VRYRERVGDNQLCAPVGHVAYRAVHQAEGVGEYDLPLFEDAAPRAFSFLLHWRPDATAAVTVVSLVSPNFTNGSPPVAITFGPLFDVRSRAFNYFQSQINEGVKGLGRR